ncbi:hypothetical protein GCM10011579_025190 [Streptomyces albiflavescens]|uniref:Uncharacterized protein n=1 Tax=Streptomyces albiflavescens TaxID=1623582 RepID=A0A918D2R5_9ACTN|nr:hypothetical protein GCM10011579_025190 [Streptomyces albiflavescens]
MGLRVLAGQAAGSAGRASPAARAAGYAEAALFDRRGPVFQGGVGLVLLCHADNVTQGK